MVFGRYPDKTIIYALVEDKLVPVVEMLPDDDMGKVKEAARIVVRMVTLREELSKKGVLFEPLFEPHIIVADIEPK